MNERPTIGRGYYEFAWESLQYHEWKQKPMSTRTYNTVMRCPEMLDRMADSIEMADAVAMPEAEALAVVIMWELQQLDEKEKTT